MPNNPNQNCTDLNDLLQSNPQAKAYFQSLPAYIQETMHQSGATLQCESDLRSCAENMMKKQ
ncbi:MAG: hypothetical protein HFJ79_01185 [Clostridiales bacterium]|nr:hypothetical protein [Clostridiales bacterium]